MLALALAGATLIGQLHTLLDRLERIDEGRPKACCTWSEDHINFARHQLGCVGRDRLELPLRILILDHDVATLDVAEVAQSLEKSLVQCVWPLPARLLDRWPIRRILAVCCASAACPTIPSAMNASVASRLFIGPPGPRACDGTSNGRVRPIRVANDLVCSWRNRTMRHIDVRIRARSGHTL